MDYTKLKSLVLDEAKNIQKFATPEEKAKLNPNTILSHNGLMCIYGQMIGDCFSHRATELLNKCAKPYSDGITDFVLTDDEHFLIGRGEPRAFSPIEYYIADAYSNKQDLARFIKGEIFENDLIL